MGEASTLHQLSDALADGNDFQKPAGAGGQPMRRTKQLHPGDIDRELTFANGLSGPTIQMRVQYAAKGITREDAVRLLELDYVDTLAIGAFIDGPAGEELVGVSRYAREPGSDRAECAIVVADAWQGRGLGTELMRSLGVAALPPARAAEAQPERLAQLLVFVFELLDRLGLRSQFGLESA